MNHEYLKIISETEIFRGIDEKEIDLILNCFHCNIINYKKSEYIALIDEKFQGIGLILSGEAVVLKESYSGTRTILTNLKAGDIFGEVIAFTKEKLWPSSVQAESDCSIIFLNPEKILNYCEKGCSFHKILLSNLVRLIAEKTYILHKKVEYLSVKSARGRISKYLIDQYKKRGKETFSIGLNREKLAEFLNITRPSLSRELCNMRDEGIIEFYKDTIKILEVDKLNTFVE